MSEYGVTNILLYYFCRIFGHNQREVGKPIFHDELIEQDFDCVRCGLKGTSVAKK